MGDYEFRPGQPFLSGRDWIFLAIIAACVIAYNGPDLAKRSMKALKDAALAYPNGVVGPRPLHSKTR